MGPSREGVRRLRSPKLGILPRAVWVTIAPGPERDLPMLPLSRRTLLKNAPRAAASMTLLTSIPEMLRAESLAAAPGIQLYTVGKELTEDLAGTLAKISAIGYKTVESAGMAGKTAAEFRKALDAAGLKCASSHFFDPGRTPEQFFEDVKTLGAEYAVSSDIVKP